MCRIIALLLVALATACATNDRPTTSPPEIFASPQERASHWRDIMPLEVPVGSGREELITWLKERRIDPSRSGDNLSFIVEEMAGDGWACSVWVVRVKAIMGEGKVEGYEVGSEGVCL